jgi:hypothetical protein
MPSEPAPRRLAAVVPAVVTLLLLAPALFRGEHPWLEFGLPGVYSGDEPHYLVLINSLIEDGDLDLANNYDALHAGRRAAGRRWAQLRTLDHHTSFVRDGRQTFWPEVYDAAAPAESWAPDDADRLRPPLRPGACALPPGVPEYSYHQPGVAFLLGPVLWPLRGTRYVEPAAILCSSLAVVAAFFLFRSLVRGYTADESVIDAVSAVAFLGTPAWFYGRSLFLEGFLLLFVTGAYALALRRNAALLPGVLLALALQLKAYAFVLALPLFAHYALCRQWRRGAAFGAVLAAGVFAVLATNKACYGGWLTPPQPFVRGDVTAASLGLLFSPCSGVLWFAPVVPAALCCWPRFVRRRPHDALVLGSAAALMYLTLAHYAGWHGAAFGPRYLTPVLPLVFAALAVPAAPGVAHCWPLPRLVVGLLAAVSVAVNAAGAVWYTCYWLKHPAIELAAWLFPGWKMAG